MAKEATQGVGGCRNGVGDECLRLGSYNSRPDKALLAPWFSLFLCAL